MLDQTSIDNVLNPLSFSNHRLNPEQPLQKVFKEKKCSPYLYIPSEEEIKELSSKIIAITGQFLRSYWTSLSSIQVYAICISFLILSFYGCSSGIQFTGE